MKEQLYKWGSAWIGVVLSGFSFLSLSAQSVDGPKGLYNLMKSYSRMASTLKRISSSISTALTAIPLP